MKTNLTSSFVAAILLLTSNIVHADYIAVSGLLVKPSDSGLTEELGGDDILTGSLN